MIEIIESVLANIMSTNSVSIQMFIRRFFYKLLQHRKLEKALRLAIDLSTKDIYIVCYNYTLDKLIIIIVFHLGFISCCFELQ